MKAFNQTLEEFEAMKQKAVDKWIEAVKQTEDTYQEWWEETGATTCSFCRVHHNCWRKYHLNNNSSHGLCPLWVEGKSEDCHPVWDECDNAYLTCDFSAFHEAAKELLKVIEAVTWEDNLKIMSDHAKYVNTRKKEIA